jgi:periodic tryptophan protein 1
MIPALCWIPRGAARERPVKFEISAEEMARVRGLASDEAEIEKEMEEGAATAEFADLPPGLNMDKYDDSSDDEMGGVRAGTGELEDGEDDLDEVVNEDDEDFDELEMMPTAGGGALAIEADSEDEDADDDEIRRTDALLCVAITEDDFSHLEVQLLSDDGNVYTHHDITLPEFPLCLAWMDCPPYLQEGGQQSLGNYIAVGTFDSAIEIWNLDVLDPLEPTATLGGIDTSATKKKHKKHKNKAPKLKEGSHDGHVLCMSWNKNIRQVLCSGSSDKTVKIWDVTTQVCSHTFTHHTDKVQAVQFHPSANESWLLATGSFDRTVALVDCRTASVATKYGLPSDIEAMAWDPFNSSRLYVSTESGHICCIDVRQQGSPLFTFQAHEKAVSSLSFSASVPGMLATASVDKVVKVWDSASEAEVPQLIAYKSMNIGKLFTLQYYPNNPFLLACAGDKGQVAFWESDEVKEIEERFSSRVDQSRETVYSANAI